MPRVIGVPLPNLGAWRLVKGFTPASLSRATGISRQYLYVIENGGNVSEHYIFRLANALGITPQELVEGQPPEEAVWLAEHIRKQNKVYMRDRK